MKITREVDKRGTIVYRNEQGKIHREDGPALIWADGTIMWYNNGKLHREDGPAVIGSSGMAWWYKNNYYHREDGPAVIWSNGTVEYWIDGEPGE